MYGWIWRHLPGGRLARAAQATFIVVALVIALFLWVFPAVQGVLPWNDVTIEGAASPFGTRTSTRT